MKPLEWNGSEVGTWLRRHGLEQYDRRAWLRASAVHVSCMAIELPLSKPRRYESAFADARVDGKRLALLDGW